MIEINNLTKARVNSGFLKKVAKIVLRGENIKEEKELSIALISRVEIKKLNQKYRNKNQPTDILSFNYASRFKFRASRSTFHVSNSGLGEIILCPEVVKKNARIYKSEFKKELARVLIHGILHLLGYEHEKGGKEEKLMEAKTKKYLEILKLNR